MGAATLVGRKRGSGGLEGWDRGWVVTCIAERPENGTENIVLYDKRKGCVGMAYNPF
jgi:hypothetical protein